MPELERELDERNRITLTKEIFDKWGDRVMITPNTFAAIMYPKNTSLEHVIKSTEILLDDLKHRLEVEREKGKR